MSKKLVQINVVCNGSTGRIMNQIQEEAQNQGWAKKYGVVVNAEKTACVIELNKGELVREINLDQDLAAQM